MMSPEYKIKPNYGVFNFVRNWQKNGTEKILAEFYEYKMKQMLDHMEAFITVIKTLIQVAPATYKTKIANGTEPKFKFLRMVASWTMQPIKIEYFNTSSSKQLAKFFLLIEKYVEKHKININWFYEKEDLDMLMSGNQYSKFLKLNFTFIEY